MDDHAAPPAEDRHTAMLRELAAMSLTLARELQQRALQAETPDEAVKLATAFHRVSRGLRQTLALELKVVRYRDDQAREAQAAAEAAAAAARPAAIERRREQVRHAASRAIWVEHERPDWQAEGEDFDLPEPPTDTRRLACDLHVWLDRAVRRPDFLDAAFDDLVLEACDAIGADPAFIYGPTRAPAPKPDREPAAADTG